MVIIFGLYYLKLNILQKLKTDPNTKIIMSDVRFQNEIDMIHNLGGYIIKLNRPTINNTDAHESEKNIDNLKGDFNIINDGSLQDLYNKVDEIIGKFNCI